MPGSLEGIRQLITEPGADWGHPADYVASRAIGRRAKGVRDWGALLFAEQIVLPELYEAEGPVAVRAVDRPWAVFIRWLRRFCAVMEEPLRGEFASVLAYHELRDLFSALRFKARPGSTEPIMRLMAPSTLNQKIKGAIAESATLGDAAGALRVHMEAALGWLGPSKSATDFEASSSGRMLEILCRSAKLHEDVRAYFEYLASLRNLMALQRHLRWSELMGAPPGRLKILDCGFLDPGRILRAKDEAALSALVERMSGGLRPESLANLEGTLVSGLLRHMRMRAMSSATSEALAIDAIARAFAEARNLALLMATPGMDRTLIRQELAL